MDDVYDLFQRGTALLEAGDFNSATVPLEAPELEPEKTSIREALGRAYFRTRQFEAARVEFEAVVERAPTNDYALFCLGRWRSPHAEAATPARRDGRPEKRLQRTRRAWSAAPGRAARGRSRHRPSCARARPSCQAVRAPRLRLRSGSASSNEVSDVA